MSVGAELRAITLEKSIDSYNKRKEEEKDNIEYYCEKMKEAASSGKSYFRTKIFLWVVEGVSMWEQWAKNEELKLEVISTGNISTNPVSLLTYEEYDLMFSWLREE